MDPDLRLGHIAVRMGAIRPQDLPQLMRQARVGIPDERGKPITGLGQVLLKLGLISVDDYLYMARQVSEDQAAQNAVQALEQVTTAWTAYESGELDRGQFEEILGRSGEPILRPTEPARTFGPYTLEGEVARGGMGIVYRARDPSDRVVALKVMINADDDEVRLRRFEREAELAAALEHPNVVSIHDAGRIDGIPYFTMDLVDGESLEDGLERGFEVDEIVAILVQVARGLSHAHERGVVHRDLKPGNILVDGQGCAHITDFGLARDLARLTRLTAVGQAVGTPYYMAPEQVRGERDVDGRADVYAAGVILYEALTGDVPFDAETPLTLFRKIDAEPVVLELDEALGIDASIRTITLRALAKEREDRYPDALHFAEDLERYQQGLPPGRLGQDFTTRLLNHRLLLPTLALALLAILSAALAGSLLWSRHQEQASLERGALRVRESLEATRSAADAAEAMLRVNQAEQACDAAAAALAGIVSAGAEGPEARGAEEAFREQNGPALVERLHRILLQGWVARTANAPSEFPLALRALDEATAPGIEASAELSLAAGVLLTRAGRAVEALPLLDRAVAELDERGDCLLARARARIDLAQYLGAAADLSSVLGAGAPTSELLVLRAQTYLAQRRLSAAQTDAQRAHDLDLRGSLPLIMLGDVAREQGDEAAARGHYLAAARRDAKDSRVQLRLAELAWRSQEPGRALAHLDAAAELDGSLAPGMRIRAHLATLDLGAARRVAAQAPRLRETPREQQRVLAAWHTARAELALVQGRTPEAWEALEQALAAHPRCGPAAAWVAELALREGGQGPDAVRRVVERAGLPLAASASWLLVRARLAHAEGDTKDALELSAQAEKYADAALRPQLVELLQTLDSSAPAQWSVGIEGPELCAVLVRSGRERVALGIKRPTSELVMSGMERLYAALHLDPRRAPAHASLAHALGAQRKLEPAFEAADRALALAPQHPEPMRVYAELALLGKTAETLARAARTLADAPTPSDELRRLGSELALARGEWEQALTYLERLGDSVAKLRAKALTNLGQTERAATQTKLAEAYAATLVEREQLAGQATAMQESGDSVDRVIEVLERAVRLGPEHDTIGLQLRLRLAASYRQPQARLEALEGLLTLSDPGLIDAVDAALRDVWVPLEGEAQQNLLRRARRGEIGPRLGLGLAAAQGALAGSQDAGRLRTGLRHTRAGLAEFPGSFSLHTLHALLDVRLGLSHRARARLELLLQVNPNSSLARYALAEAAVALGEDAAADALLARLREGDPTGPWGGRQDRSPIFGAR